MDQLLKDEVIIRKRGPRNFSFHLNINSKNKEISSKDYERIFMLHIPPIWEDVVISTDPNNYIQAKGIDSIGRTQYIYHPLFTKMTSKQKYMRLGSFIKAKPKIFSFIKNNPFGTEDSSYSSYSIDQLIALAYRILCKTYIRVGSDTYKTYGLTTLQKRHFNFISNKGLMISFIGKKSIKHEIFLDLKKNSQLIKDIHVIYSSLKKDTDRLLYPITPKILNEKLKEITGYDITCKDFRTYFSNYLFIEYSRRTKDTPNNIISKVAEDLGHNNATSKGSYTIPKLLEKNLFKSTVDADIILSKIVDGRLF